MLDDAEKARMWRRKDDVDSGVIPIHRWSGWPGAWCLDCGAPDPGEEALAHGCISWVCDGCGVELPDEPTETCVHAKVLEQRCPEHKQTPCPEPYSRRHDPYSRARIGDEAS